MKQDDHPSKTRIVEQDSHELKQLRQGYAQSRRERRALTAEISNLKKVAAGLEALVKSQNHLQQEKDEFEQHMAQTREMHQIEATRLRVCAKFS